MTSNAIAKAFSTYAVLSGLLLALVLAGSILPLPISSASAPASQAALTPVVAGFLPLLTKPEASPTPTPTITPTTVPGSVPTDGRWSGTTKEGLSISFYVSSKGTVWSSFFVTLCIPAGSSAQGPISNRQFQYADGPFAVSGQFTSSTTANGTVYLFAYLPGCGTQRVDTTWTAHTP